MHNAGFWWGNVKKKPFENTKRKGKDNFEKGRKWDRRAWTVPPGSRYVS